MRCSIRLGFQDILPENLYLVYPYATNPKVCQLMNTESRRCSAAGVRSTFSRSRSGGVFSMFATDSRGRRSSRRQAVAIRGACHRYSLPRSFTAMLQIVQPYPARAGQGRCIKLLGHPLSHRPALAQTFTHIFSLVWEFSALYQGSRV